MNPLKKANLLRPIIKTGGKVDQCANAIDAKFRGINKQEKVNPPDKFTPPKKRK